jgi:enoyl-CoA hydratase
MPKAAAPAAFETILLDRPLPGVFRITLNRPDSRNAQDAAMLYELNAAFDFAARDADIKVIILAANGPHFSAGHDLRVKDFVADMAPFDPVGTWCGFGCKGAEGRMAVEKEMFLGLSERWRNVPKVTIAQVQGKVIAGGLMLVWPCDLIVAAEDAQFADTTLTIGVAGAEFFNHPWEVGVRKAKEMLFTSDFLSARDAHRLGMVNHVVGADRLEEETLALAERIARKPAFVLKLAKEAVNAAQDAQGRVNAMQTSFALHQLSHAHNVDLYGIPIDPSGLPDGLKDKATWGKAAGVADDGEE